MSLRRIRRFPFLHGLGVLAALVAALAVAAGGAGSHPSTASEAATEERLTRGPANPLLRNDGPFDDLKVGPSTVVKFGPGDYRQWYEAIDAQNSPGGPDFLTQAAYATSPDGTTWTKRGVVLAPEPAPSWERSEVAPTSMHWDGAQWILFYHGGNNTGPRAIGRATSPTGIGGFTRSPATPILQRGPAGSWDGLLVADAKVIPPWDGPDGLWRLYYVGRSAGGVGQVGLATSTDGVSFTKVGSSPVLGVGPGGAWDDGTIQAFSAEWDPELGLFRGWYVARQAGAGSAGGNAGYVWSEDGVAWTRSPSNPVLSSVPGDNVEDSIDAYRDGSRYRVVYGQYDLEASPPLRGKGEAFVEVSPAAPEPPPPPPHPPPPAPGPPPSENVTAAFTIAGSGDDGDLERGDASYPPTAPVETDGSTSEAKVLVRRSKASSAYHPVTVTALRFDTSSLPDDAKITYAELQLHVVSRTATDGRALVAEWYPAGSWPIDGGDWTAADSASAHAGTPLSELVADGQQSFPLRETGAIDLDGLTALRLHVSGHATAPTGPNDVVLASFDDSTLPAPTLVVTYRRDG